MNHSSTKRKHMYTNHINGQQKETDFAYTLILTHLK